MLSVCSIRVDFAFEGVLVGVEGGDHRRTVAEGDDHGSAVLVHVLDDAGGFTFGDVESGELVLLDDGHRS